MAVREQGWGALESILEIVSKSDLSLGVKSRGELSISCQPPAALALAQ